MRMHCSGNGSCLVLKSRFGRSDGRKQPFGLNEKLDDSLTSYNSLRCLFEYVVTQGVLQVLEATCGRRTFLASGMK